MPELRKLRLVRARLPEEGRVPARSEWRRRHQHRARACHYRKRGPAAE